MAATSVQDMSRVGEECDLFYYDSDSSRKQAFPTTVNTKYVQAFPNPGPGSAVFTIPPNNGIQDVVVEMVMPAIAAGQAANLELPRGWGYAIIKQVSYRYGGSSQYFLQGDQILQNALRKQSNRTSANDILVLGGQFATGAALSAGPQTAAVVLTLPHNVPSGVGKSHPLPTDLLTQQCQITVELKSPAEVFGILAAGGAGALAAIPAALTSAQFQVQQVMFNNQGDSLARRVDMASNAYAFPAEFTQQVARIALTNAAGSQPVVLTGFRSGEVKALHCWLTRGVDLQNAATNPAGAAYNPWNWYLPASVQMTYAGDVYARYELGSSALWNLINGNKSPAFDNNVAADGGAAFNSAPAVNYYVELPFAQTLVDEDSHYTLVHGRPITNGIINLDITTPTAQNDWVLNVSYVYNTTLLFSQGTCDYVF